MTIDEYAVMIKKLSVQSDDIQKRVWGGDAGAAYWWTERSTMFSADGRKVEGFVNDEATIHFYEVLASLSKGRLGYDLLREPADGRHGPAGAG